MRSPRRLTSAVHDFAHHGGGHDVVRAQVVGQLPPQRDDDGHDQVRQRRQDSHLRGGGRGTKSITAESGHYWKEENKAAG